MTGEATLVREEKSTQPDLNLEDKSGDPMDVSKPKVNTPPVIQVINDYWANHVQRRLNDRRLKRQGAKRNSGNSHNL